MGIRTEMTAAGAAAVFPEGALDLTAAPALRSELHALVRNGAKHLVVDLSAVGSIDSTALGAIVSGLKEARRHGGDLRLTGLTDRVATLLKLTKLDEVLKVIDASGSDPA